MKKSNFDKSPEIRIKGHSGIAGWKNISDILQNEIEMHKAEKIVIAIECYHGVNTQEIACCLKQNITAATFINSLAAIKTIDAVETMVHPFVTDDPVFGKMAPLELNDFFDASKISLSQDEISAIEKGAVIVYGEGASLLVPSADILIYADMPRWEIQLRFRGNSISNLGANNANAEFSYKYKRSFFVDWRVCDRHKKTLMNKWNYVLDTTKPEDPKMVSGEALNTALEAVVLRPFRVVPFFDPGPWGGQWLKEVCDLDRNQQNFAWGFDCVPEENSLLLRFDNVLFETPSINVVFSQPFKLLGEKVYEAFGAEFPIRFDFLDTMDGGNLSLQVHPLKEYIREKFGMAYTQDESYYILDAKENAFVYLGLKEEVVPERMMQELQVAQQDGGDFDAEKYVEKWPIKKHDHILIPAGTVHCSGADTVVLEISATPYIFTFKLWDWGRMGLNGKPRPISLDHGKQVIQWNRTAKWTKDNIINQFNPLAEGRGWCEERTGLDVGSFIETRRHWFITPVSHHTSGTVNVLNLIEGREAIVESPINAFDPFIVHYAETFIVPAEVGAYTIRPYGESEEKGCATIKAFIRTEQLNYQSN